MLEIDHILIIWFCYIACYTIVVYKAKVFGPVCHDDDHPSAMDIRYTVYNTIVIILLIASFIYMHETTKTKEANDKRHTQISYRVMDSQEICA